MHTAPSKAAAVFVHGFGSSPACWDGLCALLEQDDAVTSRFDLHLFEYPTALVNTVPVLQRIPRLAELAEKLKDYLDSEPFWNRDVTLIGHSQGGLVIHAYLRHMLSEAEARQLEPVRQVITFATPHGGSTTLPFLRRVLARVFDNPQERALRVLDPETAEVVRTVKERAATASEATATSWPVPVYCFGGLSDKVVPEASAKGPFKSSKMLSGDHFTILRPKDRQDDRYAEFTEVLLDPGHPKVFEIERYETRIAVRPVPRQAFTVKLGDGAFREVETDNVCELRRTVQFARGNRCRSLFNIRYSSSSGSAFTYSTSHQNEARHIANEYEKSGDKIDFKFAPRPKRPHEKYALGLEIYNGFGRGRRDVHFHLGPNTVGGLARYRSLTYELDLSAYVRSGYAVPSAPRLYLHREDPGNCRSCLTRRNELEPIPPAAEDARGLWRWELFNLREGVVDVVWDVAQEEKADAT